MRQDIAAGDGTTSVVVLCGALLKKCLELLQQGVHPTIISDGFNLAVSQAVKVRWQRWERENALQPIHLELYAPVKVTQVH